ncbi:hypothetical protein JCM11641_004942 [Rhodosporidiobolus odoratus]
MDLPELSKEDIGLAKAELLIFEKEGFPANMEGFAVKIKPTFHTLITLGEHLICPPLAAMEPDAINKRQPSNIDWTQKGHLILQPFLNHTVRLGKIADHKHRPALPQFKNAGTEIRTYFNKNRLQAGNETMEAERILVKTFGKYDVGENMSNLNPGLQDLWTYKRIIPHSRFVWDWQWEVRYRPHATYQVDPDQAQYFTGVYRRDEPFRPFVPSYEAIQVVFQTSGFIPQARDSDYHD